MICDVCTKNQATVFLTQIVDGKMQKVNLCEACSKEKGVADPTSFALTDLLHGLGAAQEIEPGGGPQRCPVCGFSQGDFKKTGRLGCAACYDTFGESLQALITDVVMPRINGVQLAEILAKKLPKLRILFVSGHCRESVSPETLAANRAEYLQKPYRSESLVAAVQQDKQGKFVLVVGADDKVSQQRFEATRQLDQNWIVDKGLNEGQKVIVNGIQKVHVGQVVNPQMANVQATNSQPATAPGGAPTVGG